jgi:Ni/Co efflux regulator RcnB
MKTFAALLLAVAVCLPAFAQDRGGRERQIQKQGMQPRERVRDERREMRRERGDREDRRHFSHEERRQLRQDLIDANRAMKHRR